MYTLGSKLKELRKNLQLSQEELSIILNKLYGTSINKGMISKWENSKEEPRMEYVRNFANYFKVSLDYLLGVEDAYNPSFVRESDGKYFTKNDEKYDVKVIAAHALDDLNEEQIKKVLEYAKFIKSQEE